MQASSVVVKGSIHDDEYSLIQVSTRGTVVNLKLSFYTYNMLPHPERVLQEIVDRINMGLDYEICEGGHHATTV